ncbi:hypothetical protein [Leptospira kirschneri]|uniref:hypothetical protein n=1 Tax=Leptospira kirschneri TaxID=29507 RepID=UPI0002784255|nr:hypothetical protein [Leptospira kirschneri]EJO71781.1 hypothetical protein LEP1GSC044_0584 [Leptospira kirschneri serovar Grippotyphosa str. RM52]EKQ85554.1 hypothetical protein LEP1GSC064_0706 [Leptospira kirschneri serovar Grippotyphosa str. Moskva]EKR09449.1 hypothetical protein LEP1GSC122_0314 [Leptospira kirschneri serovar Valbuzzi str. 200702274]EMK07669.1 hypothetical protein LEP1GSC176_0823 [Leptospira kirschneri str. MMD1493]EPG49910.1 hypothetical protein LEP1GSC049_3150 [Leptosp
MIRTSSFRRRSILFLLSFALCFIIIYQNGPLVAEDSRENPSCSPADRGNLVLNLHLFCKWRKIEILTANLNKDKIRILGIEKESKRSTTVKIEISEKEFGRIFSGSMEYRLVERSSGPGLYCQSYVKTYRIPKRYRRCVRTIEIPDPQLE